MKRIICMFLIVIVVMTWIVVFNNGKKNHGTYDALLEKAEQLTVDELYIDALGCYMEALKLYESIDIKLRILDIYKILDMTAAFESYAKKLYTETGLIDVVFVLGDYYMQNGKYDKAIEWYEQSKKKYEIDNNEEVVNAISERLKKFTGIYTKKFDYYDSISEFHNGFAITLKAGKYGIIDNTGKVILKTSYDDVGLFSEIDRLMLAPAKEDSNYFFVDKKNYKRKILNKKYSYVGAFSEDGYALVIKDNCNYTFINKSFDEVDQYYSFATPFLDGISIIKDESGYHVINNNFEIISKRTYNGTITNELGYAVLQNLFFMRNNEGYVLVSSDGKEVSDCVFEDAIPFSDNGEYTAVKINGKWGFIDKTGSIIIEPSYTMAGTFSCGLAPVMLDGMWGYINKDNEIIIEPQFTAAKAFNSSGYAPVCMTQWYMIGLKYYER